MPHSRDVACMPWAFLVKHKERSSKNKHTNYAHGPAVVQQVQTHTNRAYELLRAHGDVLEQVYTFSHVHVCMYVYVYVCVYVYVYVYVCVYIYIYICIYTYTYTYTYIYAHTHPRYAHRYAFLSYIINICCLCHEPNPCNAFLNKCTYTQIYIYIYIYIYMHTHTHTHDMPTGMLC